MTSRGRLEVRNVTKKFSSRTGVALQDVTLTCEAGEFIVLVGPSGCGKSTLLSLAAGMLLPEKGTLRIDGELITGPGPDRAVVFQEHGLFPWLNVEDNVAFGLRMKGMSAAEQADNVEQALRAVRLLDSRHHPIHELSGGMRQRVSIARALVLDPSILLMDEPFAALDAQTRTLLHHHVQEIWMEMQKTVLFVTHSIGEAVRLADRIVVMGTNPGRVRREIPILLEHPRDFDSKQVIEIVHTIREEIEEEVNAQEIAPGRTVAKVHK